MAYICLLATASMGCTSKLVVSRIEPGMPSRVDGLYYALPKTVLQVQVPVLRSQRVPGDYAAVARYFFPFAEPPGAAPSSTYAVETATLGAFGVPDASHVFAVKIKGGLFEDKTMAMAFGEDGGLEKYEAEATNRTGEFITQIIKSAASLGAKALTGGAASATPSLSATQCELLEGQVSASFREAFARACGAMSDELQRGLADFLQQPGDNDAQARLFFRALAAFQRIQALEGIRDAFLQPTNIPQSPGAAFTDVLSVVEKEMSELLAEFFGSVRKTTYWTALYEVTPPGTSGAAATVTLFRYSRTDGICDSMPAGTDGLEVRRAVLPPATSSGCAEGIDVQVRVHRPGGQYAQVVEQHASAPGDEERGLFYRIPAKAHVSVQSAAGAVTAPVVTSIAQFSPAIAQFGAVVSLPASTGGRRTQYGAELFSTTGAIRNFKLGSDAVLDKQTVADLGEAAEGLVAAEHARRKQREAEADERAQADDELTKLKRQADILEAQVRIKKAQDALAPAAAESEPQP